MTNWLALALSTPVPIVPKSPKCEPDGYFGDNDNFGTGVPVSGQSGPALVCYFCERGDLAGEPVLRATDGGPFFGVHRACLDMLAARKKAAHPKPACELCGLPARSQDNLTWMGTGAADYQAHRTCADAEFKHLMGSSS